ncbi:MAG: hypothetical protein JJT89_05065, partial [Nitriliruptoraceae bacterium]|nr:hypothetical protein [Nitriliruptoraceae bacterium]
MAALTMPSFHLPRLLDAPTWMRFVLGWRLLHLVVAAVAAFAAMTGALEGPARIAAIAASVTLVVLDVAAIVGLLRTSSLGRSLSLAADYLTFLGAVLFLLHLNRVF